MPFNPSISPNFAFVERHVNRAKTAICISMVLLEGKLRYEPTRKKWQNLLLAPARVSTSEQNSVLTAQY
jgi:hypothetical protein